MKLQFQLGREGQEERSRALRRRLKAALPEEGQQAIKAQQVQLREEGRGAMVDENVG